MSDIKDKWTDKDEVYNWLRGKSYHHEIAEELSTHIAELYNGAFRTGKQEATKNTRAVWEKYPLIHHVSVTSIDVAVLEEIIQANKADLGI